MKYNQEKDNISARAPRKRNHFSGPGHHSGLSSSLEAFKGFLNFHHFGLLGHHSGLSSSLPYALGALSPKPRRPKYLDRVLEMSPPFHFLPPSLANILGKSKFPASEKTRCLPKL